jgi:hypothetical protein
VPMQVRIVGNAQGAAAKGQHAPWSEKQNSGASGRSDLTEVV